jgi:lipid A 3-O-deacylase
MRKLFVITALLFIATGASAQWRQALNSSTLYWENDNFGVGRKSDRFYTNGVRYSAVFSEGAIDWRWPKTFRDSVWRRFGIAGSQPIESVGFVIGQNFYTPQVITIAAPQPLDRPWAGVLYGGLTEGITDADQRLSHVFELHLGVLGQGAGAQATQKFVHNDLGFSDNDPIGWHNQLRNEPTLELLYQQMRRYSIKEEVFDVVPAFGALLGSPQTYVNAGGTVRLGYHVSGLPVGVIPGAATALNPPHKFEIYLFAGADGRLVPFNATLDGGLFNDGPEAVGPKRFVTDLRGGFSARWRWVRLTYSVVERSAEFDTPPGAIASQRFGSFALTIEPFDTFK